MGSCPDTDIDPVFITEICLVRVFLLTHFQERAGKRAADDDIFAAFKRKKDENEANSALIPREEVIIVI